ncbi:hypothetical protein [Rheinheimera aquimaris]|uniref:hypothetical protein n=1 Tax=Rheinheimera aquimaris TaxID=412437 RepID=UPI003A97DF4E
MCNLSSIAHAVLQQLKSKNSVSPTRAQTLELLAAYFGYKTYAAYQADSAISEEKLRAAILERLAANARLISRLLELSLPESLASQVTYCIIQQLQTEKLEPQISLLRIAQYLQIAVGRVKLDKNERKASYDFLAKSHDAECVLLRYVWQSHELERSHGDNDDYSGASAYWYQQRQAGAQLSAAATQWANAYERQLALEKGQQDFLSAYADAILARPNTTDIIRENAEHNLCCQLDTSYLLFLFERLPTATMTDDFYYEWHYLATLQRPSHESLVELAEGTDNPIELWALHLFAKDNNIDITADNHWAINSDTGAIWDEYGPAEVAGYDGITLPNIRESQKHDAKLMSERMQSLMNLVRQPTKK